MGLLGDVKVFDQINWSVISKGLGLVILSIIIFLIFAVAIGIWLYLKYQNKKYNKTINWFEEVNGRMIFIESNKACELTVPKTNVKIFYIKSKDLYLPRGVLKMGVDSYWYAIRKNREIVNFVMKNLNDDMKEAGLDYDHTDMRYANENLREIIDRSYRQKSVTWWKEYKDLISTVVFIFVMSLAFFFLLTKIASIIGSLNSTVQQINEMLKSSCLINQNSGVIISK